MLRLLRSAFLLSLVFSNMMGTRNEYPAIDPFTPFDTSAYIELPYGLDDRGLLIFDYGERYDKLGKYPNPTFIAAYANALYRDYIAGDESAKDRFFIQVDYLMSNAASVDERRWPYPFENTHYGAPKGWYSGMTSGRILGVLVRAHALSGSEKYLQFANEVFKVLRKPLASGGMSSYQNAEVWIEEVASEEIGSFGVLNGHIFGLAGLLEYARYTQNSSALSYSEMAIQKVLANLENFDSGFLSYYSENSPRRNRPFAERGGYNTIHVMQMLWLYSITDNSAFLRKSMTFNGYDEFNPTVSASFSTDYIGHGPDKMNLKFGNSYWSSYMLPVDIEYSFKQDQVLNGMVILGHTPTSTPRKIFVQIWDGIDWKGIARVENNGDQQLEIKFTYPVRAKKLKITMYSDNGNGAVALDGVGLYRTTLGRPIVNFENFTVNVSKLFDGELGTGILVKNDGFILIPNSYSKEFIEIYGDFASAESICIHRSNDLDEWKEMVVDISFLNKHKISFKNDNSKYYKVSFDKAHLSRINEIVH